MHQARFMMTACTHLEPGEIWRGSFDGCDEQISVHRGLIQRRGASQDSRRSVPCDGAQDAWQLLALIHADVSHGQEVICAAALCT